MLLDFRSPKFQRHILDRRDLRVVGALDIEIVQPPHDAQLDLVAQQHAHERAQVRRRLCDVVKDMPHPWPAGFERCTHYAPFEWIAESDLPEAEADHWLCKNCQNGVTVKRVRFLDIYARALAQGDPIGILSDGVRSRPMPVSVAPYADPARSLSAISTVGGVSIVPVASSGERVALHMLDIEHTLCFLHICGQRPDVAQSLQAAVDEMYAERDRRRAEDKARYVAANDQHERKRLAAARRFLG